MNLATEVKFNEAVQAHDAGKLDLAIKIYNECLISAPENSEINFRIGKAHLQIKNFIEAEPFLQKVLEENPGVPEYWETYIDLMIKLGNHEEAEDILKIAKKHTIIGFPITEYENRLSNIKKVIDLFNKSDFSTVVSFSGKVLDQNEPSFAPWLILGASLQALNKYEDAVNAFKKVIFLHPKLAQGYNNLGVVLKEMGLYREAIQKFRHAISIRPEYPEALNNLGITFQKIGDRKSAYKALNEAISSKPTYSDAINNIANILEEMGEYNQSEKAYKKALSLQPALAEAHNGLGVIYSHQGKSDQAVRSFRAALAANPDHSFALAQLIHEKLKVCDWTNLSSYLHKLSENQIMPPFTLLACSDNPKQELQVAKRYTHHLFPNLQTNKNAIAKNQRRKLRIGYFSADFKDHPVCRLIIRVFELHNRQDFEVFGYSLSRSPKDEIQIRACTAFDNFQDLSLKSEDEIVSKIRKDEIDIAIDLSGYTKNNRVGIFSKRVAPIQINYLGFPGSMGASFMDYIIADANLIPIANEKFYSEKIIFMPDCYQAQDNTVKLKSASIERQKFKLPEHEFVFCAINATYKISEAVFKIWLKLLLNKSNSVLWLLKENNLAEENLRKFASSHGVEENKLIFAERMQFEDYLEQFKAADIYLDTFNYNAGATASNALWAGLPVITLEGESYSARMAGSLLRSLGLNELVTKCPVSYYEKAIELAHNQNKLQKLRQKLKGNLLTKPLFDSSLFTKNLEIGYEKAFKLYQKEKKYKNIYI